MHAGLCVPFLTSAQGCLGCVGLSMGKLLPSNAAGLCPSPLSRADPIKPDFLQRINFSVVKWYLPRANHTMGLLMNVSII